ncbi:hypothetical protein CHUAL_004595 [Chamberlinius hualienensis]
MFSRKKVEAQPANARRNGGQRAKAQMPLFDMSGLDDMDAMDDDVGDDGDEDLEAELAALQAGVDIRKVVSRRRLEESLQPKNQVQELESDDGDDDEDVDENDPDLLAELGKIEGYSVNNDGLKPSKSSASLVNVNPKPRVAPAPPVPVRPAPLPHQPLPPQPIKHVAPLQPPLPVSTIPVNRSATSTTQSTGNPTLDLLQERMTMYKTAHQNAVSAGETAKVRRLDRGIKTLQSLTKSALAGKPINEEDIPLPVAVSAKPVTQVSATQPSDSIQLSEDLVTPLPSNEIGQSSETPPPLPPRTRPAPEIPSASAPLLPTAPPLSPPQIKADAKTKEKIEMLTEKRNQYRQAAVVAKRRNDMDKTREYVKIAKKFDLVIEAMEQGQEVDLNGMPPSPPEYGASIPKENIAPPGPSINIASSSIVRQPSVDRDAPIELPLEEVPDDPSVFKPPPPPVNILEALQQRLQKYQSAVEEANSSENSSKARRMGRIVKQYEDAIKRYKSGKPIDFDELPTPPGFAPIPTSNPPIAQPTVAPAQEPQPTPANPESLSQPSATSTNHPALTPKQTPPSSSLKLTQKSPLALHEKQLAAILERQKLFKDAALNAKKRGDIQAAKEYLRVAKGFDPMIKAATCGLPVNMDSLPIPPQSNSENTFELICKEDCEPGCDRQEMFEKLEKELLAQIEMCSANRTHFSKIGDVQNAHKFETLGLHTKKDLSFIRYSLKRGDPVPRFHYETKTFSIVKCCTDLGDDDLELSIIKGINYSCPNPNEIDTYVKFEFPFPLETSQKDKTQTVKNTNNPEYNATFKISINRKSRNCTSVFKRKGLKLEVWSKGGFLRSDTLLGSATVKLTPLETRCILHESYDLMEGRKPIGGKLEVKLRIREPILTKQVDTMCEKWLIISANNVTRV